MAPSGVLGSHYRCLVSFHGKLLFLLLPPPTFRSIFFLYTFPCLPDNFLACYRAAESQCSQADLWGRSTVTSATAVNTSIVMGQLSFGAIEPYKPRLRQNAVHTANTPMCAFLVWSWGIQQQAAFKGIFSY